MSMMFKNFNGINNVHDPTSDNFMPKESGIVLQNATNVYFTDEGYAQAINSKELVLSGTYNQLFTSSLGLIARNGGAIELNPHTEKVTLINQLNPDSDIIFYEHNREVYWFNGEERGKITSSGAINWGLSIPTSPSLSSDSGALDEGRYLVALTYVDANGIESAADSASLISIENARAIVVDNVITDPNVAEVNIWCSKPNGTTLFFIGTTDSFPIVINDVNVSDRPLRTQFLVPPIIGDGMFAFRGFLLIYKDSFIYVSDGVNASLFDPLTVEQRPHNIIGGGSVDDGFWTICKKGAFWTSGDEPKNWVTEKVNNFNYAIGCHRIDGSLIPALETQKSVILFISNKGLMAGLSGGRMVPLTQNKVEFNVEGKKSIFSNSSDHIYFSLLEV